MKRKVKVFLSSFLYYSGLLHIIRLWNNINGRRLTVLAFHRVTDKESSMPGLPTICVSGKVFKQLLKFIVNHYTVISLQDCLHHIQEKKDFPPNCLLLTFDDGYEEVLMNALPVLKKYRLPAVMFVPTATINTDDTFWWDSLYATLANANHADSIVQWQPDMDTEDFRKQIEAISSRPSVRQNSDILTLIDSLQDCDATIREKLLQRLNLSSKRNNNENFPAVMNWRQVQQFHDSGFEVGSHTVHHHFLTTVSAAEADSELKLSKIKLEEMLDEDIVSFSYPGGKYDEETVQLVMASGYQCAFTSDAGINSIETDRYKLKRINIYDDNLCNSIGEFSSAVAAWCLFLRS